MRLVWIAFGGAAGTLVRYGIGLVGQRVTKGWPLGTLTVNVAGCFVLALVAALAVSGARFSEDARLAITVGFCGGLTTYSTFNQEALNLMREGSSGTAAAYFVVTVALCAGAGVLGLQLARMLSGPA
jgi:fluoride exporter